MGFVAKSALYCNNANNYTTFTPLFYLVRGWGGAVPECDRVGGFQFFLHIHDRIRKSLCDLHGPLVVVELDSRPSSTV